MSPTVGFFVMNILVLIYMESYLLCGLSSQIALFGYNFQGGFQTNKVELD